KHAAAVATIAAESPEAAISSERRAAITAGRALIAVDVKQPHVGDVSARAEHKSGTASATKRVAAISVPAVAAVTASTARSASSVATSAARSETTGIAASAADRDFPQHGAAVDTIAPKASDPTDPPPAPA